MQINLKIAASFFFGGLAIAILLLTIFVPGRGRVCVIGDYHDRLKARVSADLNRTHFDAALMQIGFGNAAIGGWNTLGDAMAINGRVWLRSTQRDKTHFFKSISGRYFQTNAFVYIPIDRTDQAMPWRVSEDQALSSLWGKLARRFPDGVVVSGYLHATDLRMIAIARPTIHGIQVQQNAAHYYTQPLETASQAWLYIVGLVANTRGWSDYPERTPRARLMAMINENTRARLHGLHLMQRPRDFDSYPTEDNIMAIGEVLSETHVTVGRLSLWPIHRVDECHRAMFETN